MVVNEESTLFLDLSFEDRNGVAVVPDSITYRIDCDDEAILAEQSIQSPASEVTITINSDENQILQAFVNERYQVNVVTVVAALGSNKKATAEYEYKIKNLRYIS